MPDKKQTSKSPPKVFDVAKPGKSAASPTSRPVIVSNRPIMQDPMVMPDQSEAIEQAAVPKRIVIKPLSEEEKSHPASKSVAPAAEEKVEETGVKLTESIETHIAAVAEKDPEIAANLEVFMPPESKEAIAEKAAEKPAPEPAPTPIESSDTTDTEDLGPRNKEAQAAAEAEARAKRQAELDALIEARKYALPINAAERRRSKRFIVFGFILVILLVLAWINLALDAGLIVLNGIEPLTHFFTTK